MANLSVTYDDMKDAATRLKAGEQEINARLAQLRSLVDSLVSGGYVTDKSSVAFDRGYAEFTDGAKKTISGLDGMSTYLTKAAELLQQTDSDLANALQK